MKKLILLSILFIVGCEEPEDCAGDAGGNAVEDCFGVCSGEASIDSCGVCSGGTTDLEANYLKDCLGVCSGDGKFDNCGVCDADSTNDCVQDDCGVWGGNNSPNTGTCDCFGVPSGEASLDCAGDCDGEAVEDNCGTCDSDPYNDCFQDCDGNWLTRSQSCVEKAGAGDNCDILNPIDACTIEGGCDDYCGGSDCVLNGLCLPSTDDIFNPNYKCQCYCGEIIECPSWLPCDLINDCNIPELITANTISDECRNIVEEYLPSNNSLPNILSPIGKGLIDGNPILFIMGSDILGSSIDLTSTEITITSIKDNKLDTLDTNDYNIKTIQNYVGNIGTIVSLSSIIDYSGSMRSGDIDDAVEIYKDIFTIFNPLFESEIRLFSNCVIRKVDFISNQNILIDKIERDERIARQSTSLYDAIGEGLNALSTRDGLIKLLVVSTDGLENSSVEYTDKNQIIELAEENKIPIIIFGTLFSDLTFMIEIAEETNGLFIFNSTFKKIKNDALLLYEMLSNIQAIEITGEDWTNATSFQVTIDGKTLVFNLD